MCSKQALIAGIFAAHLVVFINNGVSAQENEDLELQCSQVDAVALNVISRLSDLLTELESNQAELTASSADLAENYVLFLNPFVIFVTAIDGSIGDYYDKVITAESRADYARSKVERSYKAVWANLTLLTTMLSVRETYCSEVTDGPGVFPKSCSWGDPERNRVASSKAIHTMEGVSLERCKIACEVRRPDCQSIRYDSGRCRVYDTIGRFDPGSETNFEHYTCDLPPT